MIFPSLPCPRPGFCQRRTPSQVCEGETVFQISLQSFVPHLPRPHGADAKSGSGWKQGRGRSCSHQPLPRLRAQSAKQVAVIANIKYVYAPRSQVPVVKNKKKKRTFSKATRVPRRCSSSSPLTQQSVALVTGLVQLPARLVPTALCLHLSTEPSSLCARSVRNATPGHMMEMTMEKRLRQGRGGGGGKGEKGGGRER